MNTQLFRSVYNIHKIMYILTEGVVTERNNCVNATKILCIMEKVIVYYSPRKLKLHIWKSPLEEMSTYSPVLMLMQASSFS